MNTFDIIRGPLTQNFLTTVVYFCHCFVRYIQAATSPKDIVILIDASGSMTGLRLEIAKHTVRVIISTLADDDFFNVLTVRFNAYLS